MMQRTTLPLRQATRVVHHALDDEFITNLRANLNVENHWKIRQHNRKVTVPYF